MHLSNGNELEKISSREVVTPFNDPVGNAVLVTNPLPRRHLSIKLPSLQCYEVLLTSFTQVFEIKPPSGGGSPITGYAGGQVLPCGASASRIGQDFWAPHRQSAPSLLVGYHWTAAVGPARLPLPRHRAGFRQTLVVVADRSRLCRQFRILTVEEVGPETRRVEIMLKILNYAVTFIVGVKILMWHGKYWIWNFLFFIKV